MKDTTRGYFAITLQASIIGLSYMFVKIALKSAGPVDLLAHRFTAAVAAIFILRLLNPDRINIKMRDLAKIIPLSFAYPIFFFLFQTLGLKSVSSSEAGIVYAMIPILTLIAAKLILGESLGPVQKAFMLLSISGVVFVNVMTGLTAKNHMGWGILFIFISAVTSALYNVFARKLSRQYSTFSITYVMTVLGFVSFNLISIIQHAMKGTISDYFEPFTNASFTLSILYLGVLSSLLTSFLSNYALGKLEASTVGQFNNFSIVVSILAGVLFLRESLYYYHYIGILAILTGTIGFNYLKRLKEKAVYDEKGECN